MASLQLVVDASEHAFAGCLLQAGAAVERIQIMFNEQQRRAVQLQRWGSTPREIQGMRFCCEAIEQRPNIMEQLQHRRLRVVCDSQGTQQVMASMGGSSWEQLEDVHGVGRFMLRNDIQPVFAWQPRDSQEVRLADALSKRPDPHDQRLQPQVFEAMCSRQLPTNQQAQLGCSAWGRPTADLFASAATHTAPRYFTLFLCRGAAGTDAFTADWGKEKLAYIFPGPLYPADRVIHKILHDRCNCIAVFPRWHKFWEALLRGPHVRDSWDLKYHPGLYEHGPLVPERLRGIRVPLVAYRIDFTGL